MDEFFFLDLRNVQSRPETFGVEARNDEEENEHSEASSQGHQVACKTSVFVGP